MQTMQPRAPQKVLQQSFLVMINSVFVRIGNRNRLEDLLSHMKTCKSTDIVFMYYTLPKSGFNKSC